MSIKVGIVGLGGIAARHAQGYDHLDAVELVAFCDINPEALKKRADEFDVTGRYDDYQKMIDAEDLDLISVCTQAPMHAPVAIAAAQAGVHVLSEKPLSVDLERADQMIEAARQAGVKLAVSHQYRFSPAVRRAKKMANSGKIGKFRSVREIGKGREAGFELMEMGVHYFDEMDFLMGGIEWVHAQISYQGHSVTGDDIMHSSKLCTTDRRDNGMVAGDTMTIHLGGPNGVSGIIELYKRESRHGWVWGPHLLGESGQIMVKPRPHTGIDEMWFCPFDVSFAAHTPPWERVKIPQEDYIIEGKAWGPQHSIWSVQNMIEAIRNDSEPELGGQNALTSLQCVSAVYESHFTGSRAYLPLPDRRHPLVKRLAS